MKKILVTGASGFIGLHCINQLLQQGYRLKGVVHCKEKANEVNQAMLKHSLHSINLEIIVLDVLEKKGWEEALSDCSYVLHIPDPAGEDQLRTTVKGALCILNAAKKAKIKKVVMTSSLAAVMGCDGEEKIFSEDDWTDPKDPGIDLYSRNKTLAELEAWNFVAALPANHSLQLTVIIPSAICGPILGNDIGTSNAFIAELINGRASGLVNLNIGWVDVRDVARAHIEAMLSSELDGQRIILCERTLWVSEIVEHLKVNGFQNLPRFTWPNILLKFVARLRQQSSVDIKLIGKKRLVSNKKAGKFFTWKMIGAIDSIAKTAEQLNKNR